MHEELPEYERLQDETAAAARVEAKRVLELGIGTGETTRRVLAANPSAFVVGVDASSEMLARARAALPSERVELLEARLEDPLPDGPFDAVVTALAVHHLDGPGKADLFRRVSAVLVPGGRFVLGDVIVPKDPSDVVTPIDGDYDTPSTIADQTRWLEEAGLSARVHWAHKDLAVLVGDRMKRTLPIWLSTAQPDHQSSRQAAA
jgi:tRNA (cmo5U34)-methyltransferase